MPRRRASEHGRARSIAARLERLRDGEVLRGEGPGSFMVGIWVRKRRDERAVKVLASSKSEVRHEPADVYDIGYDTEPGEAPRVTQPDAVDAARWVIDNEDLLRESPG